MSAFTVYTTDANPQLLHSNEAASGIDERVDGWVDQLARVTGKPVDLFVDVPGRRIVWTMEVARGGPNSRSGWYLADYIAAPDERGTESFVGLRRQLLELKASHGWAFSDDEPRWRAGFELPDIAAGCPGIDDVNEDRLATAVAEETEQLVLGMSSYDGALRTMKRLTERGVDATLAINGDGATAETEGIDLVLWPGADEDFVPMDDRTRDALAGRGFSPAERLGVAEERPSADRTQIKERRETPSALESFVGDGLGRVGLGMTVLLAGATVGALAAVDPLHPLSGLAALGGLVGAVVGLVASRAGTASIRTGAVAETDGGTVSGSTGWGWQQYGAFLGFYLLFAYAFPSIFRLAGWPFGPTIRPVAAVSSALLYVGVILVVSLVLYAAWGQRSDIDFDAVDVVPIVGINACFALGLVVLTGFACSVWYPLIGFSGAC